MPYQHCPACRLTVMLDDELPRDSDCPRCGAQLADEPRRLFDTPPPAVDTKAVRAMLSRRGGRPRASPG